MKFDGRAYYFSRTFCKDNQIFNYKYKDQDCSKIIHVFIEFPTC